MIRVRFKPLELMSKAEEKDYPRANAYDIIEDNTVVLYEDWLDADGELHRQSIGHINRDRWDDVVLFEEVEGS